MIRHDLLDVPLWHGTAYTFDTIDLSKGRKNTDFGKGFYLTSSKEQARQWAERGAKDLKARQASLMRYEFEGDIKRVDYRFWPEPCAEWLHFVISCRDPLRFNFPDITPLQNADMIAGAVADDQVYDVVTAYTQELYGAVGSPEAIAMAIQQIKPGVYKDQICFKTPLAISMLHLREVVSIHVP